MKQQQGRTQHRRTFSQPWPWILLAVNPLLIIGGVFHPDPYIKIIFVAAVLGLTLLVYPWRTGDPERLQFSLPELCWLGYLLWAAAAILWSSGTVVAYERWMYLLLPTAAYVVARQTVFWRSALFWNVFAVVALVVGVIGMCMYLFAGTPLGFDWIESAGRPSSTLSYRAYAGTYLALSLPFLAWLLVSRFARSGAHAALFALSLATSTAFLAYTRARSAWLGVLAAAAVMALVVVAQRRWGELRYKPVALGALAVSAALALLPPSAELLEGDIQHQRLQGTGKETFTGAIANTIELIGSGGSDRFGLWAMASDIAFRPTLQGDYGGPFGTPRWIFGAGLGQYPILTAEHGHVSYILGAEVHNDWFQAFLELGPIGFALLGALVLASVYYAWKARAKGVMVAALGGLAAWVFSTQTDFLTMRIYGAIWVAAILAMVRVEAQAPVLLRLRIGMDWRSVGRRVWGLALLWIAVSFGITMSVDSGIYTALKNNDRPLDEVVRESMSSYRLGMGKYLLFTGFSELSRVLAGMPTTDPLLYDLQDTVGGALLAMHPNNIETLQMLRNTAIQKNDPARLMEINDRYLQLRPQDVEAWKIRGEALILAGDTAAGRKGLEYALSLAPESPDVLRRLIELEAQAGEYDKALEHMAVYLEAKPEDMTVRLFKSQTELLTGDSAAAARTAYDALRYDTTSVDAQRFWQIRIGERHRKALMDRL